MNTNELITLQEAIPKRISVRAYDDKIADDAVIAELSAYLEALNEESRAAFAAYVAATREGESVGASTATHEGEPANASTATREGESVGADASTTREGEPADASTASTANTASTNADADATDASASASPALHFQLYGPRPNGQTAIDMSSSMFTGTVYHYAALVGPDTALGGELVGYFGEKLILRAVSLSLGTCWVASTYDKETVRADLAPGERLWDVVPLGYPMRKTPLKQRTIRASLRARNKSARDLVRADTDFTALPDWFQAGIEAVIAGPSAINGMPVVFSYADGVVSACVPDVKRDVEYNDLGIAKLHFQLGAASCGVSGTWEWGQGGAFRCKGC